MLAIHLKIRNLEHSTVLYETENNAPLLKLAWNRNDPHYVAVIEMDQCYVALLDTRLEHNKTIE